MFEFLLRYHTLRTGLASHLSQVLQAPAGNGHMLGICRMSVGEVPHIPSGNNPLSPIPSEYQFERLTIVESHAIVKQEGAIVVHIEGGWAGASSGSFIYHLSLRTSNLKLITPPP